jgi:hypothetical protein
MSSEDACDVFTAGILKAANILDSKVGGIYQGSIQRKKTAGYLRSLSSLEVASRRQNLRILGT